MGGDTPKPESMRSILDSLAVYAPRAIQAISETTPATAQKELEVAQLTSPGYAALQNQIYRDYGPEANRLGAEFARANTLAAVQAEADAAAGPGRSLVTQADELQRQLDPEYYADRKIVGDAISKYLGSYSPTELTGSEIAQINRGIAANEGPMTPSALRTVKNAQTFGDAATNRWKNFGEAVVGASSALPSLRSGISGFEVATRRPLTSNTGDSRLSSPEMQSPTSAFNTNFGFANNILSEMGAHNRAAIAKSKSTLEKVQGGAQAAGGILAGVGALI